MGRVERGSLNRNDPVYEKFWSLVRVLTPEDIKQLTISEIFKYVESRWSKEIRTVAKDTNNDLATTLTAVRKSCGYMQKNRNKM